MARDIILRTLAGTPGGHPKLETSDFREEPIVISTYGGPSELSKAMARWVVTGDVFRAALKELDPANKDIEIGRRALVSFSAGWYAGHSLLKSQVERDRLSAYIVLDGVHTATLDHWVEFGVKAAKGQALMVLAHSQIKPPYISAKQSNTLIYEKALEKVETSSELTPPPYVLNAELPEGGVTLQGANKKHYDKDTLVKWDQCGQLARLEYEGGTGADHLYVARIVGPRLNLWLAEVWNTIELDTITVEGDPNAQG